MSEEKKEEKTQGSPAQATAQDAQAKVEHPAKTPPQSGASARPPGAKAAPKREKPSNCASCNKLIGKKRWYYRNGKFYCSKKCWKTMLKKDEKKEAESVKK